MVRSRMKKRRKNAALPDVLKKTTIRNLFPTPPEFDRVQFETSPEEEEDIPAVTAVEVMAAGDRKDLERHPARMASLPQPRNCCLRSFLGSWQR